MLTNANAVTVPGKEGSGMRAEGASGMLIDGDSGMMIEGNSEIAVSGMFRGSTGDGGGSLTNHVAPFQRGIPLRNLRKGREATAARERCRGCQGYKFVTQEIIN